MFADDTNVAGEGLTNLDQTIITCERWADRNDMSINKKKSRILFMEGQMKFSEWELSMRKQYRGYNIGLEYRSLGVIIQRDGYFNQQAQAIIKKANSNNKLIDCLKRVNANPEYKVIVWYSHIQSHFRYAGIIWNNEAFG